MKNQKGSTAIIILVSVLIFIGAIVAVCAMSYVSAYNYGNRMDNQLTAIKENNKNIYAQGTQKILEMVQVPSMYTADLKTLIEADIQGRYGKEGSKATFQFLKEHDVKLDSSLYLKIQQTIESFRNEFQNNQTKMIDVKRSYLTGQGSLWAGFWMRLAGFPKINMAEFNAITTDNAESVYKAGKESTPLKLR